MVHIGASEAAKSGIAWQRARLPQPWKPKRNGDGTAVLQSELSDRRDWVRRQGQDAAVIAYR